MVVQSGPTTPVEHSSPASPPQKRSAVEGFKETSRQLRGKIALQLVEDTDHFDEAEKQLLKFHGTYQQEDRDARKARSKSAVGKHYMFMVRCRIPGGRLTAAQYLAVDELAGKYANGTLRLTSRQGIQLHGVLKSDLQATIAGINQCLLTTLGACGDVERNIMACPAPVDDGVRSQLQETAALLAAHLAPRSRAYHEIWLNGKRISDEDDAADVEPLYGKVYLPRKFKTGLALPEDNCIDIYAQDLGLLAIVKNGAIEGYNVLVGGGMGMTHGNASTFPHLARPICFVPVHAVLNIAEAVIRLFRDHGNRADRKRARIKYLVHDWGVEKFRELLAGYVGGALTPPRAVDIQGFEAHLGWQAQRDGKWFYGLSIENGRIKDESNLRLRTGLRSIVERFRPELRITPVQDLLLCGLDEDARPEIERIMRGHGIPFPDQISNVQKLSMACPAIPTCGLAISESERALPGLIDELEQELNRIGLANEKLSVRMTGCPNGCARPYQSDVGIVGRSGNKYTIFVGGHVLGHRLNFELRDLVPREQIVPLLVPLFEDFKGSRRQSETFGDYCQRLGAEQLNGIITLAEEARAIAEARRTVESKMDGQGADSLPRLLQSKMGPDATVPATVAQQANGAGHAMNNPTKTSGPVQEPATKTALVDTASALSNQTPAAPISPPLREDFFAGSPGEEVVDYSVYYSADGTATRTAVKYYGTDLRAGSAHRGLPLRRVAVYRGMVDPNRLYSATKLTDTFYAGPAGQELCDYRLYYNPDGSVSRTAVYFYGGGVRAGTANIAMPFRRRAVYTGKPF